jgi:hypothetical protein
VAALTFYVNKASALSRWWLGIAVAVVGLALLYFTGSSPSRTALTLVSPICFGLSFGPLAWTVHRLLRRSRRAAEKDVHEVHEVHDVHEDLLHNVGDCANPRFNIVFVHGIAGHHRTTWQAERDEGSYWPAWVAQEFTDAQVYALHYNAAPSHWLGRTMPLIDRGNNLLNLFTAKHIFGLPSVFIVHSFGGLVLKQLWRSANDRKHQDAINSIQAIIFLATPHHGSLLGYLEHLTLLRTAARTTQTAQDLQHHSQLLRNLDEYYRNRPIPKNFVYFETQTTRIGPISVKVIDESSASLALPGVHPVGLTADHLSICKPSSPKHDIAVRIRYDLRSIHNYIFGQEARPNRFEIDSYEIRLAVEPREMQDFVFGEGTRSRTVRCDNIATLVESVTFAPDNQFRAPYLLRYSTKHNGFIKFTTSHVNKTTADETSRYADYGVDAAFRFTPEAGEAYQLHMEIYKGFDDGQRCMARHLAGDTHYKRVSFTLDLTAYAEADYSFPKTPALYRHFNYERSATSEPIGTILAIQELTASSWQWELKDVDAGVLNLIFDVVPPAISVPKWDAIVAAGTQATGSRKPAPLTADDLDNVFHPQKYRGGRGSLVPCRFNIMSPQFRNQFKWEKLADVLVEVLGGLPLELGGKDAYLIPSGRARPRFWDARNLRADKGSLDNKRAATEDFVSQYQNQELQGYWFTMKVAAGDGIGVYCLAYDLFLNARVTPHWP